MVQHRVGHEAVEEMQSDQMKRGRGEDKGVSKRHRRDGRRKQGDREIGGQGFVIIPKLLRHFTILLLQAAARMI